MSRDLAFCDDVPVARREHGQVVVIGEALIDLVMPDSSPIEAVLGGAPFNTARALARLGGRVELCATISSDRFGGSLLSALAADGVGVAMVERCDAPTTLAAAELSIGGSAEYRFYIEGTSAPRLERRTIDPAPAWLFTGGLGLVLQPLADRVIEIVDALPASARVMVDVNARPRVIDDPQAHRARVEHIAGRCDVMKVSDEDLSNLFPGSTIDSGVERLLAAGARLVVITAGGQSVRAIGPDIEIEVPVPSTDVVDTIGAGDTFDAGMLSWWTEPAHCDLDPFEPIAIRSAIGRGIAAASVVVGRRGADPPRWDEMPGSGAEK